MIVLVEKDPFVEAEARSTQTRVVSELANVRRPLNGLVVKDPRPAFLSVYQDGGSGSLVPISLRDSSAPGGWSNANHNFILTGVTETRQEKAQIMETFGDDYVFFYGQKAIVLACTGMLLNTEDFNWKNEWFYNYNHFLRGTKCVENRARLFLGYDDVLVQGYVLGCQVPVDAQMPNVCPLTFQVLLTKEPLDLSPAGGDEVPGEASRTYVSQESETRHLADGTPVEYLSAVVEDSRYAIDPLTGNSVIRSEASPNVPDTADNPRSAFWVSPTDAARRQWRSPGEALLELNARLAAQQAGVDEVTARLALRASPSRFQAASRTDATVAIAAALGLGISHASVVVADDPGISS